MRLYELFKESLYMILVSSILLCCLTVVRSVVFVVWGGGGRAEGGCKICRSLLESWAAQCSREVECSRPATPPTNPVDIEPHHQPVVPLCCRPGSLSAATLGNNTVSDAVRTVILANSGEERQQVSPLFTLSRTTSQHLEAEAVV